MHDHLYMRNLSCQRLLIILQLCYQTAKTDDGYRGLVSSYFEKMIGKTILEFNNGGTLSSVPIISLLVFTISAFGLQI